MMIIDVCEVAPNDRQMLLVIAIFFIDAHCIKMVESGIADKLLKVLSSHNSGEGDIRLQHAILSALRNLSIARQNKPVLVQQVKSVLWL